MKFELLVFTTNDLDELNILFGFESILIMGDMLKGKTGIKQN